MGNIQYSVEYSKEYVSFTFSNKDVMDRYDRLISQINIDGDMIRLVECMQIQDKYLNYQMECERHEKEVRLSFPSTLMKIGNFPRFGDSLSIKMCGQDYLFNEFFKSESENWQQIPVRRVQISPLHIELQMNWGSLMPQTFSFFLSRFLHHDLFEEEKQFRFYLNRIESSEKQRWEQYFKVPVLNLNILAQCTSSSSSSNKCCSGLERLSKVVYNTYLGMSVLQNLLLEVEFEQRRMDKYVVYLLSFVPTQEFGILHFSFKQEKLVSVNPSPQLFMSQFCVSLSTVMMRLNEKSVLRITVTENESYPLLMSTHKNMTAVHYSYRTQQQMHVPFIDSFKVFSTHYLKLPHDSTTNDWLLCTLQQLEAFFQGLLMFSSIYLIYLHYFELVQSLPIDIKHTTLLIEYISSLYRPQQYDLYRKFLKKLIHLQSQAYQLRLLSIKKIYAYLLHNMLSLHALQLNLLLLEQPTDLKYILQEANRKIDDSLDFKLLKADDKADEFLYKLQMLLFRYYKQGEDQDSVFEINNKSTDTIHTIIIKNQESIYYASKSRAVDRPQHRKLTSLQQHELDDIFKT